MRNCDISSVTENDILDYFRLLEGEMKIENNSIIPKSSALRQFFKYWNQRCLSTLDFNCIPMPKQERKFPKITNSEDYAKFWGAVIKPSNDSRIIRNRALFSILAATGIRNGEACGLRMENVNAEKGTDIGGGVMMYRGVVKTEKTRGMRPFREIFWNEEVNRYVKAWLERRKEVHARSPLKQPEFVFVGLNGRSGEDGWGMALKPNSVDELFRVYSKKSGVKIRPHMLRHMLGRDMAKNNASDHVISDVLGHSRLDSSRIYTMLFGTDVAKQFNRFRGEEVASELIKKQ
jgi:site-specific recombinase XerD